MSRQIIATLLIVSVLFLSSCSSTGSNSTSGSPRPTPRPTSLPTPTPTPIPKGTFGTWHLIPLSITTADAGQEGYQNVTIAHIPQKG